MKSVLASILILMLASTAATDAQARVSPDVWRQVAQKMPIGSFVKVQTTSRDRLEGVLFVVDEAGIIVKPRTRIPEPARRVRFDQIDDLRLDTHRRGLGKAAAIGAAIGGGALLVMLLIASHVDVD